MKGSALVTGHWLPEDAVAGPGDGYLTVVDPSLAENRAVSVLRAGFVEFGRWEIVLGEDD